MDALRKYKTSAEQKEKSDTMVRKGLSSLNYRFSVSFFRLSYPPESGTKTRQDPSFLFFFPHFNISDVDTKPSMNFFKGIW
jgi:hypothetical protein